MGDLAETVIPKSDQLNADDLISGPLTITVRDVTVKRGEDQPCSIFYDGDNGKPYKPSKGMRRLLMMAWNTDDSATFIGRSMTLWRNPDVLWAGKKEGGIRISHLSHLRGEQIFSITVSRGKREHITVKPLATTNIQSDGPTIAEAREALAAAETLEALEIAWKARWLGPFRGDLGSFLDHRKAELSAATITPESTNAEEGRTDADHGEQHDGADENETFVADMIARAKRVEIARDLTALGRELSAATTLSDDQYDRANAALTEAEARINGKGKA